MASRRRRTNKRHSDFRIRARGVHRPTIDIPRLTRASLDHYLATQESDTPTDEPAAADDTSRGGTTATEEQSDDAA